MTNSTRPRLSVMALLAFALAILSFVISFVAGIPALLLAAIGAHRIQKHPDKLGGLGYARTATTLALIGSCFSGLLYLMPTALAQQDVLLARARCARNLRDITTAMCVYANENNDDFPLGAAPAKPFTYSVNLGMNTGEKDPHDALMFMQSAKMAGNIFTPLMILAIREQVEPQKLLCPEDSFVDQKMPLEVQNKQDEYAATPANEKQISYSISYPWNKDPETGKAIASAHWRNSTDSSLPIISDMAPLNGTGKPARDLTTNKPDPDVKTPQGWNKGDARILPFAHNGEGLNVGFADAHVEWTRSPRIGQSMENIFISGATPAMGGIPEETAKLKAPRPGEVEPILKNSVPVDTVMVPLRDGDTGKIR